MRLSSMMLKRLLLAGNNFTAIAGLIFSDYFNKLLINDKCGNIDLIKLVFDFNATFLLCERTLLLIVNETKYYHSSIIFLVNEQIFFL